MDAIARTPDAIRSASDQVPLAGRQGDHVAVVVVAPVVVAREGILGHPAIAGNKVRAIVGRSIDGAAAAWPAGR